MIAHWKQDGVWEPAPLEKPYGRGVNFFIWVEDVHALYEAVLSSGFKPFVELHTRWYWRTDRMDERTEFGLLDPDGYLLRFSQVDPPHRPVEQSDLDELDRKHGFMPLRFLVPIISFGPNSAADIGDLSDCFLQRMTLKLAG